MMAKGASIKYKSYQETVQKILDLLKLEKELKKYDRIILKPNLVIHGEKTKIEFVEEIIKFCLENKNPVGEILIAEGADGQDTAELFDSLGYKTLAEKYHIGLVDLNNAETEELELPEFLKFQTIHYPKILREGFVISLPELSLNKEKEMSCSLSSMLGAFPASHYKGLFSNKKNKIRRWPINYSIHDIIKCKMPDLAVVDASSKGFILAGLPLEIDKQSAKILGMDWKRVGYLNLLEEDIEKQAAKEEKIYSKLY